MKQIKYLIISGLTLAFLFSVSFAGENEDHKNCKHEADVKTCCKFKGTQTATQTDLKVGSEVNKSNTGETETETAQIPACCANKNKSWKSKFLGFFGAGNDPKNCPNKKN